MWAAEEGHTDLVKMLLDRSANIEAVDGVSRNVNIACTALRIVLIIIMIFVTIIVSIIILFLALLVCTHIALIIRIFFTTLLL